MLSHLDWAPILFPALAPHCLYNAMPPAFPPVIMLQGQYMSFERINSNTPGSLFPLIHFLSSTWCKSGCALVTGVGHLYVPLGPGGRAPLLPMHNKLPLGLCSGSSFTPTLFLGSGSFSLSVACRPSESHLLCWSWGHCWWHLQCLLCLLGHISVPPSGCSSEWSWSTKTHGTVLKREQLFPCSLRASHCGHCIDTYGYVCWFE